MNRLERNNIRAIFNAQKYVLADKWEAAGVNSLLKELSIVLADFQAEDIDISLDLNGTGSEQAFYMLEGSVDVPVSGILTIGTEQRLLAISTEHQDRKCLLLALSDYDIRYNGVQGVICDNRIFNGVRATVYDFWNDPEAMANLQRGILRVAICNSHINDMDSKSSFGRKAAHIDKKIGGL